MTTAYITHPLYLEHDIPGHPESPDRLHAIWTQIDRAGLLPRLRCIDPLPVTDEQITLVHSPQYVEILNWIAGQGDLVQFDADTYALPISPQVARLSAGGVTTATDAVLSGKARNALCVTRPPGHHAVAERAMGFCLLGNVAIAARHAQKQYGIRRVLIVDYDVHHGNGTQDMFYDDDSVLFVSTHQSPLYPGTGLIHETGDGAGRGYTLNIPVRAGVGDTGYRRIYDEIVWQAAHRFQPEFILVSAGFDGHWRDPLASVNLSLEGYAHLTHELIRMADALCGGKIVFALEGGYDVGVVSHGVRNIAHALLGDDDLSDPFGARAPAGGEPDVSALIAQLKVIHGL